ncbi:transmembrane protein 230-like [Hyaena hyaena]|uniref:transmembrane protein 230-like n=1 Tax=Hyaena hyaena TaxID=95912 RepID=UPI0019213305|nr:transmembrane protein 230-like [Hyaena hyaena]
MIPSRTNVAAGIPSSKVKYSKLSGTGIGHIDRQKETSPTEGSFKSNRSPVKSCLLKFKKNSTRIPYKAVACAAAQFLRGAFLPAVGCLLLAGYISKVGANRAVATPIVGILVSLPGFYHLLTACRAHRRCQAAPTVTFRTVMTSPHRSREKKSHRMG